MTPTQASALKIARFCTMISAKIYQSNFGDHSYNSSEHKTYQALIDALVSMDVLENIENEHPMWKQIDDAIKEANLSDPNLLIILEAEIEGSLKTFDANF